MPKSRSPRIMGSPRQNSISPKSINSNFGFAFGHSTSVNEYYTSHQKRSAICIQPFNIKYHQKGDQVKSLNHIVSANPQKKACQSVANTSNCMSVGQHKKSQSLYKKKIVDIIQGLQQSLGVIANKVKGSMNQNTSGPLKSEQALLESAILAQKLALLTSNMNTLQQSSQQKKASSSTFTHQGDRPQKSQKRNSSKKTGRRQQSGNGRSADLSTSGLNAVLHPQKHYYKTIEDDDQTVYTTEIPPTRQNANDYKIFVDGPHQQAPSALSTSQSHVRARSDAQSNRMKSLSTITSKPIQVQNVKNSYYFSIPSSKQDSFTGFDQKLHNLGRETTIATSRLASSLIQEDRSEKANGLKIVQNLLQQSQRRSARPQSASISGTQKKAMSSSALRTNAIHKRLNQIPTTVFKPSVALHKKSTSDAALLSALFASNLQNKNVLQREFQTLQQPMNEDMSKSSTTLTAINMSKELTSKRGSQNQDNISKHPTPSISTGTNQSPRQSQQKIVKCNMIQSSTTTMPTPSIHSKQMLFLQQQLLSQKIDVIPKNQIQPAAHPSQKKQLTIKAIRENEALSMIASGQQVQPFHKRMRSEGKSLLTSSINLVTKKGSQSRERSADATSLKVQPGVNFTIGAPKERKANRPSSIENRPDGQLESMKSPTIAKHNMDGQSLKMVLKQTLQCCGAYQEPKQKLIDAQLTARSDTFSSGFKCPSANLMSNETTLKKKAVYPSNRPQQFLQLTVDPPEFNHYAQKNSYRFNNEDSSNPPSTIFYYDDYQGMHPPSQEASKQMTKKHKRTSSSTDQKLEGSIDQWFPNSPPLNIMPTPKAIQPFQIGGQYSSQISGSPSTCIKNPRVVVPNNQAVGPKSKNPHKRQQSAAFNAAFISQINPTCDTVRKEERVDTTMSTMLSPRSREKKRLCKMIKMAFSGINGLPIASIGVQPIKTTSEFYRIGKMLGKGAFGRVNLAMHKLTEHLVAVKSMNKQFLTSQEPIEEQDIQGERKKLFQELLILKKVATRHRNIVRLYDSFETARHLVFVMELCAGGDLLTYVRRRGCLSEDITRELFNQAVSAVHYCHRKGIVHRDIKLDNLLLDIGSTGRDKITVKLCDFGVSRLLQDPATDTMTEQCGTPAYIAPEILLGCQVGASGYKGFTPDVWSLGVCLYAMLFGTVPFKANNMNDLHQMIVKAKYSLKKKQRTDELSRDLKSLLRGLLEPDPAKRLTMTQLRKHQWLVANSSKPVEIFTEQELQTIRKDFTYQEMAPGKSESRQKVHQQVMTTEHNLPLFTEHELDEECGGEAMGSKCEGLIRNCSTKSMVLAPFNSTWSDKRLQEHHVGIDSSMIVDKRVIKYAVRVKDLNRQYEMNNNCDLDNGVYNKFVNQSSSSGSQSSDSIEESTPSRVHPKSMFDNDDIEEEQNSLVTSMNGLGNFGGGVAIFKKIHQPQAPLVSQISDNEDNEDAELERIIMQNNQQDVEGCPSELQQLQTFLQRQNTTFFATVTDEEHFQIDYDIVEQIELSIGYPRHFIVESVENHEMNDSATCYHLFDKAKFDYEFGGQPRIHERQQY